jgi:hypothetical protein
MVYPQAQGKSPAPPASLGSALGLGAAVALGGAVAVGVFSGLTNYQSTYVSILLGWLVGLVVSRAGGDTPVAAAAGMLSLAGSAAGSLIFVIIGLVRTLHVPLSIVVSNINRVFPLVPHVIGWFGFLCWALSGVVGWATVRTRGRRRSKVPQPASLSQMSGGMTYQPLADGSDVGVMPDSQPPYGPAPYGPPGPGPG